MCDECKAVKRELYMSRRSWVGWTDTGHDEALDEIWFCYQRFRNAKREEADSSTKCPNVGLNLR